MFEKELIKEKNITVKMVSIIFLILGAIGYYFGLALDLNEKEVNANLWWCEALKMVGQVFISGSLITLLFRWVNKREFDSRLKYTLDKAIEKMLRPAMKIISANSLSEYRWDCYLDTPDSDDIHKNYLRQFVRLSYTVPKLPRRIKIISSVSNANRPLADIAYDSECLFRWNMESADTELDISDSNVFHFNRFFLDGEKLQPASNKIIDVKGGKGRLIEFTPPKKLIGKRVNIDLSVMVRKHISSDGVISIPSQLFQSASDAEYRLYISKSINVNKIIVKTSEITPLTPGCNDVASGYLHHDGKRGHAAAAIFRFPLQEGSAIRFEVTR